MCHKLQLYDQLAPATQGKSILFPSPERLSSGGGVKPAMAPSVTRKAWLRSRRPKGKREGPGAAASWRIPATRDWSPTIQDGWRAGHKSGVDHHCWQAGKGCEAMGAFRPGGVRAACPPQSPRRQLHSCRKVSGATAGKSALKGVL